MRPKLKLKTITALLVALAAVGASCPLLAGQQPPAARPAAGIPPSSPIALIIADAKAAGTPEGNQRYAKFLTEYFVTRKTGDAYINSFAARLSTADLTARQGKRALIPESAVVQAFNDLMSKVHSPLRTDANVVHQLRITAYGVSPSLSTVKSHSTECLPSEAVGLMIQLVSHSGSLALPCPPEPGPSGTLVQHACPGNVFASVVVSLYCRSHSGHQDAALFDHVARLFGF